MAKKKIIYKIQFHSQGQMYELYAREVSQSSMYAFIEVAGIIFGEKSKLVVDPSEERLKSEFSQVNRTYIPLHSVVRIDEVEKEGVNKIVDNAAVKSGDSNIAPFPMPPLQPKTE
jgi:hypothetical protein